MAQDLPGGIDHYEPYAASCPFPDGWLLLHAAETESTNADGVRFAEAGGAARTVLWADQQRGGRGRRGRGWVSPPGNLYASLVLRPKKSLSESLTLGFAAGVSMVRAINALSPSLKANLKWPNDVLIDGRKLAGILLESTASGTICDYVVIGMGVNLTVTPPFPTRAEASDQGAFPPVSLSDCIAPPSTEVFLGTLLAAFDVTYGDWDRLGFKGVRGFWESSAVGIGETVSIDKGNERIKGVFRGLDDSGAMLIERWNGDPKGEMIRVTVGDVAFHGAGTSRSA